MLLRNIDQIVALCNSTRLIVSRLKEHIIEAKIFTRCKEGDTALIPPITLKLTDIVNLPIKIKKKKAISYRHLFCDDC